MTRRAIFPLVIGSIVIAGLAGCQSASRWAWWKTQGDSASSVAQSSAPSLPSAGATPQAVEVPGLEPASSPSAANLAAAQASSSTPSVSLPASSASTIAKAPLANYPPAGKALTAGPATSASPTALETTTASSATASMPPSGPYDPYGYKSGTSYGAATATAYEPPANPLRYPAPASDPYAMPTSNTAPAADPEYAVASMPPAAETTTGTIDKYALPPTAAQSLTDSNVSRSAAAYPVPSSSAAAFANSPTPGSSRNVSAVETNTASVMAASPMEVKPVTTATVQLPPGKYRPGGTSDYSTTTQSQHMEVAARPEAPQASLPAGTSDLWSPPPSTAPATSGAIGPY